MTSVKLNYAFKFDHAEIPAGTVISVPAGMARDFIGRGIALPIEPERAVLEPEETRTASEKRVSHGNRPNNRAR
jgi:hypothetical protein